MDEVQQTAEIASTRIRVTGIHTDDEVKIAKQAVYDISAAQGIGQATFEVYGSDRTDLVLKHLARQDPDLAVVDAALASAGDFHVARDAAGDFVTER